MRTLYFNQNDVREIIQLESSNGQCLLIELFELYSETTPILIDKIAIAFNSNDATCVQLNSHSLKSSSANLGLRMMSAKCACLENHSRINLRQMDVGTILALRFCFRNSLEELRKYTETLNDAKTMRR